jgi:hypothetical protein
MGSFGMSATINPVFPVLAAQGVAADVTLQPGTVIDARVLKLLANDFVRIAVSNLSIEVMSEVPLQVGQALQLAVSQTADGVRLQIVTPNGAAAGSATADAEAPATLVATSARPSAAAPNGAATITRPLTNLEAIAVSAAMQSAAVKQGSMAPLFANLGVAASSPALPENLQQAAQQLLSVRLPLDGNLTGEGMKTAFQQSGLFLEQMQRAQGSLQTAAMPDLKAALIVFRQALTSWLGTDATVPDEAPLPPGTFAQQGQARVAADMAVSQSSPPLAPQIDVDEIMLPQSAVPVADDVIDLDLPMRDVTPSAARAGEMLRSGVLGSGLVDLQDVFRSLPNGMRDALKTLLAAHAADAQQGASRLTTQAGDGGASHNVPPPFRGGSPSAQPIAQPVIDPHASPDVVVHRLLGDTDAALARQTLLQIASLPIDQQGTRIDANVPRWNFEIPFATPQGTAVAQFEISRDEAGVEAEAQSRVWRARFSLDIEPAGPVHALVSLAGERTSVRMWAERSATAAQLRAGTTQLSQALREADLTPGDIVVGEGSAPVASSLRQGHFLDRAS